MKRFLKKRFLGIPILVILLTVVTAVAVLAATILTIPSHVKIVEAPPPPLTYDIEAYSDSECTLPLTFIEWGEIVKGENKVKTVYIKNVGTGNASVSVSTPDPGVRDSDLTGGPVTVAAGASAAFELTLTVDAVATPGDINFDTVFTNTLAP